MKENESGCFFLNTVYMLVIISKTAGDRRSVPKGHPSNLKDKQ